MAGVLLNLLLGLSRVLFAMARQGDMPSYLKHLSPSTKSPTRSVWAIGALISGLALLGDVRTTWTFSAFTVLIYYGITNWAALRLPAEARRFPRIVSWIGLLACFGLAAFVDLNSLVIGLSLLGLGFIARFAIQKNVN
jgi:APA family basic amino acid/polyamine antiporter